MNHYDVRSIYTKQIGLALAYQLDKNLIQVGCLAARTSSYFTGGNGYGGSQLTNAAYGTTGDTLAQGILDAAEAMDEKFVPDDDDRYVILRPKQYNLLMQATKTIDRDYNDPSMSNGTFANRDIKKVAGVKVVKSMHLPNTNISAVTGQNNTYSGNFTNTVGLVFHKSCVGTVKLLDLSMESFYDVRRQATLILAKYAMGIST